MSIICIKEGRETRDGGRGTELRKTLKHSIRYIVPNTLYLIPYTNYHNNKLKKALSLFFLLISFAACKVNYSLSGASISPEVKTITVRFFQKTAALGPASLSQTFTEALKDKFISQTNLNLVDREGDLTFEGSISNYTIQPLAIQANETAAKNRLSITVNVKFTNLKDEKQNFETGFTRYADFESSQNISSVEDQLIKEINDQLVDDIFNKAVINW